MYREYYCIGPRSKVEPVCPSVLPQAHNMMYSGSLISPTECEIMRSWNPVPTVQATGSPVG